MAKDYSPTIDQGSNWILTVEYLENFSAVSLLGYTAKLQVREFLTSASPVFTLEAKAAAITGVSNASGVVTYTATNSFAANQIAYIYGVTPVDYNLSNVKIKTATSTNFTVDSTASGAYVSGGYAMVGSGVTISPTTGKVTISATAAQTALLTSPQYVYDLKITSPAGEVTRLIQGTLSINSQVTRD